MNQPRVYKIEGTSPLARIRSPRPVNVSVDMTSSVKYHGDAGIGRAVASSGLVPDFVGAGVIVMNAIGL